MTARKRAPPAPSAARIVTRELVLPTLAGAASVFGFAPFYAWPVPIATLAVLFYLWRRSGSPFQAALTGYAFGLGYFLVGVSWVYVSLHDFGSMPAVLAAIATFLLCAFLALAPAAAGWATVRFAPGPGARLAIATAAYVLFDWVRSWIFTGFPWLTLGTSQAPSGPLAGFAPIAGVYGVSIAVAGAAALLAGLVASAGWSRARVAWLAAIAALFLAGGLARTVQWTEPAGEAVPIALLQGNVAQDLKWRDEVRSRTLIEYRRMVFETKAKVVVLPETSLPAFLDQLPPDYVQSLLDNARSNGQEILMGTVEREFRGEQFDYYNSVVVLDGAKPATYRKRHLVPFGEFIPPGFKWVLAVLKIPLSDFDRGPARQAPLVAAGIAFGIAICYEDVFGNEVIDFLPQAQVLLNVSNDAWFGESFAAEQHLQASQMRAIETGRWMVRSTNTGVTAAIDERGRVVGRLAAFTKGTLTASVVPRRGATLYASAGDKPAIAFAALLFVVAWRSRRKTA